MTVLQCAGKRLTLCFHGVGSPGAEREPGEHGYWVGRDTFLALLDDVAGAPDVDITFDDGNESDVTVALPALRERGLRATFFVLAGRLGDPGSVDADGVRELRRAGMAVGSHGMHHRPWRRLSAAHRREEFVLARELLEDVVGARIDSVAVPLGRYDATTLLALRRHGYRRVYTSDRRVAAAHAWLQPRFSIRADDTPKQVSDHLAVLRRQQLGATSLRSVYVDARALAKVLRP